MVIFLIAAARFDLRQVLCSYREYAPLCTDRFHKRAQSFRRRMLGKLRSCEDRFKLRQRSPLRQTSNSSKALFSASRGVESARSAALTNVEVSTITRCFTACLVHHAYYILIGKLCGIRGDLATEFLGPFFKCRSRALVRGATPRS